MADATLPELRRTGSPFERRDPARAHKLAALKAAVLGTPGPSLAGYTELRPVGEGGMGVVYRATAASSGRPVALKVLRASDVRGASRFAREVETLRALRHPHVVRYLDHGTTDDRRHYLVMEWLEGCDAALWAVRETVSYEAVLQLALAAASGLGHAHARGVVHRDVKPSNLFLVRGDPAQTKVIDFGVAKLFGAADSLTSTGAFLGTPAYMAPEQLEGEASVGVDVYGLGATLYRLCTGRLPIEGSSASSLLLDVLRVVPPNACAVRPELPRSLGALLAAMLAKDPAQRPTDMATVALEIEDLRRAQRRGGVAPPAPVVSADPRAPTERPRLRSLPFVGRVAECGRIDAFVQACFEEGGAGWCVVKGPAGRGKSTLLRACVEALRGRGVSVADASVDTSALRPLALVERVCASMRAQGWIEAEDEHAITSAIAAIRDEDAVLGRPVRARLDALHVAWADVLERVAGSQPRVLALDGLDRADGPSMRLLARLLERAVDVPWVLLATATDAEGIRAALDVGPGLAHDTIALQPVRARALHQALLEAGLSDATHRSRLIRRCEGDVGRLAAGPGETVSDTAETDFDGIVIRALALQQPSWHPLVAALVGLGPDSTVLVASIDRAIARGALRVHEGGRFAEHPELWLTAQPEASGADPEVHRICAAWMEREGGFPPEFLVPHYRASGDRRRCSSASLQAAAIARTVDDIGALEVHLRDVDPEVLDADQRAQWSRLVVASHMGRNRIGEAVASLDQALAQAQPGTPNWYDLFAQRVTALGQLGRNDEVRACAEQLGEAPVDLGAPREGWIVASARIASQLAPSDHAGFRQIVERMVPVVDRGRLSPHVRGVYAALRGAYDAGLGFVERLRLLDEAHDAYLLAEDRRAAAMTRMFWAVGQLRVGGWRRAREAIDDVLEVAQRLGADYMHGWARYARARLLVELEPRAALAELEAVRVYFGSSPRIASGAWVYEGWARLRLGERQAAVLAARRGAATHDALEIQAAAAAIVVLAAAHGSDVTVTDAEHRALQDGLDAPQLLEFSVHVHYALAEDARARGAADVGLRLQEAYASLLRELGPLDDPSLRSAALHGPWLHRALMQAMDAAGLSPSDKP